MLAPIFIRMNSFYISNHFIIMSTCINNLESGEVCRKMLGFVRRTTKTVSKKPISALQKLRLHFLVFSDMFSQLSLLFDLEERSRF